MFNSATVNRLRSHRRLSSESAAGSRYELLPIAEENAPRSARSSHFSAASFGDRLRHNAHSPHAAAATTLAAFPSAGDPHTDLVAVTALSPATRLYRSLLPPRRVATAAVVWLLAVVTTVPLVFNYALVGDQVWEALAGWVGWLPCFDPTHVLTHVPA